MSAWITKEWLDSTDLDSRGKPKRKRKSLEKLEDEAKKEKKRLKIAEGDTFVVEWLDPNGKRCREKMEGTGRPAKNLADDRCQQIRSQLNLGQYEERNGNTWKEAKECFVRDILPTKRSKLTRDGYKATLDRFEKIVKPVMLKGITSKTIVRFVAERLKEKTREGTLVANSTVNKDLRNLRAFFREVKDWEMLADLPKIKMLDETETDKPFYTEQEFVAIYKACGSATLPDDIGTCPIGHWWKSLLVLAWETGMRRGELLALEWSDIDFEKQSILLDPARTKTKRGKYYCFGEQSAQHLRVLAEYRPEGEAYVFTWSRDASSLNTCLGAIQEAAGIDKTRRDLKWHAFRRTVGNMTTERYGLTAAQYKLGHSSAAVTAKHYAKVAVRGLASKSAMHTPEGISLDS